MKMYALSSKKTGGVTTCQEIHKQGYLEQGKLYILKPASFHFIGAGGVWQIPTDTPPQYSLQEVLRLGGGTG